MTLEQKQSRIDAIEWYHEIDFGNGLRSKSREPNIGYLLGLWKFIESIVDEIEFTGMSVLDVGCWDGRWSFYAEHRGARSVLACDDITQNWGNGKGIWLAKELLNSRIEIHQASSVYELADIRQKFDIIFFMGVYYHLLDPFLALAQLRHCCHSNTILILEGDVTHILPPKLGYLNFLDPHGSIFIPTADILRDMLKSAYFRVQTHHYLRGARKAGWIASALRFAKACAHSHDTKSLVRSGSDRIVMICQPFYGQNPIHMYRPPFGLAQYDPRFGGAA